MSNYIIGIIEKKFPSKEVTEKFHKREFLLNIPDEKNSKFDQHVMFELLNRDIPLIDSFQEGDEIKVYFNLIGREWKGKYFTNLQAWKIEGQKWDRPVEKQKKEEPFPNIENKHIPDIHDDLPF